MFTIIPAHGRDYPTVAAALASFHAEQDWIVCQFGHRYDGKAVNKQQLTGMKVQLRFAKYRKTTIVTVPNDYLPNSYSGSVSGVTT